MLLFVYLSAFLLDNSKTYEGIPMKFGGQIDLGPQKKKIKGIFLAVWSQDFQHQAMTIFRNNCGFNRDLIPNTGIRRVFSEQGHHCESV